MSEFTDYSTLVTDPPNKAMDPRRYQDPSRYLPLPLDSPVVTYDDYVCHGCYGCDTGNDFCRGAHYEGLRIVGVDPEEVLDEIFGPDSVPMPQVLIRKLHLDEVNTYRVEASRGYYGEEYDCFFSNGKMVDLLTQEWAKWPNAKDKEGVYSYLISKNQRLLGLLPLDNLKEALRIENDKQIESVESATKLAIKNLKIDNVVIPNKKHFDEVEPKATPKGGITGVIADGKLVDGYHRLKWLKEQPRRKHAKFIVLS